MHLKCSKSCASQSLIKRWTTTMYIFLIYHSNQLPHSTTKVKTGRFKLMTTWFHVVDMFSVKTKPKCATFACTSSDDYTHKTSGLKNRNPNSIWINYLLIVLSTASIKHDVISSRNHFFKKKFEANILQRGWSFKTNIVTS